MKITFHGAARTTTGSMHLIETDTERILLDCGLYQGHRAEALARNAHLPYDPKGLTAVLLSHAHIDHSGNLPTLVKLGYAGEISCTPATRDLADLMLRDSARIQEQDAIYLNQKKSRQGLPPVASLYTVRDAEAAIKHIVGHAYDQWFKVNSGARVMFRDAGHILGSAIVVLEIKDRGRTIRVGFTGDLGRAGEMILRDPESVTDLDYLIMESTYGDRIHPSFSKAKDQVAQIIRETVVRGGKVVIPAFAVGRTQELVYCLHQQTEAGKIPSVAMFVDSPMAIDATDIFRLHLECFDEPIRDHLLARDDPFGLKRLKYTRAVEDSKAINELREPAVILSANGMCEAGRILHHLKNNIEDPRSTILFVGYQAENTLGRRLLDGVRKIKVFGDEYHVRAQIRVADGFSAHADRNEMLSWVTNIKASLKQIFVVHGEEKASLAFAEALRALGGLMVTVPELNQTIEI